MSNLEEVVKTAIAQQLKKKATDLRLDDDLVGDLNADSIDLVSISMELESALNIEVPTDELHNLATVQDFINYIGNKQ